MDFEISNCLFNDLYIGLTKIAKPALEQEDNIYHHYGSLLHNHHNQSNWPVMMQLLIADQM
jgi:hypothetical protein